MSVYTRRQMLQLPIVAALGAASPPHAITLSQAEVPKAEPPIKTRMFWIWDHSTEWSLNRPGAQTLGASNLYARSTETFLQDYTHLLQWCGCHSVDAVVVWGLLRDSHGGLDAAKRLCDAASKHRLLVHESPKMILNF